MSPAVAYRQRLLRAVIFATVLTGSAALAHASAGGMVPVPAVLAGAAAVLAVGGWWLAGRARSALTLGAAALTGQAALHLTFALTMAGMSLGRMSMASMLCGQRSGGFEPVPLEDLGRLHLPGPAPLSGGAMAAMMAAHVVGGVLVLLALRSVESLVAAAAALLAVVLLAVTCPTALVTPRRWAPAGRRVPRLRSSVLLLVSPRRGPPACVCS